MKTIDNSKKQILGIKLEYPNINIQMFAWFGIFGRPHLKYKLT